MNFRSTAMLFGLLVGMLWLFGLMLAHKKTAFEESFIVPSLHAANDAVIDSLTIERKGGKDAREFKFVQDNEQWTLQTGKASIRLENFRVNGLVNEIKNARKNDEASVRDDPAFYGLESPQIIVTLKGRVGAKKDDAKKDDDKKDDQDKKAPEKSQEKNMEWQLKIGKESADKSQVYVISSDRPTKVLAVTKSTIDSLFLSADVNGLRSRQLFEFSDLALKNLLLRQEKKDPLELLKSDDESWRIVQPKLGLADYEGTAAPKDPKDLKEPKELPGAKGESGGVKALITTVRGLRVESEDDFVSSSETNPADYGLVDGKEALRIQATTQAEQKKDDKKAEKKEEKKEETLLIGHKIEKEKAYYARLASDPGIFKLSEKQLEPIFKAVADPGQLRSRDVVPLDTKKVRQINLTRGEDVLQLKHEDDKNWQIEAKNQKPARAFEKAVDSFLEALQGKREIHKFLDDGDPEAKKLDSEKPAAVIALYTTVPDKKKDEAKKDDKKQDKKDDKKEEKKDDKDAAKPAVTLTFGAGDKDAVPVKREQDGTVLRFTITRALADKLLPKNGYLAFLDTALPAFAANDVTTLTLQRGKGKPLEMRRASGDKAERWLLKGATDTKEESFADPGKVQFIMQMLSTLRAKKWQEKVDAKTDLEKLGLNNADAVVRITLDVWKAPVNAPGAASLVGLLGSPFDALLAGSAAKTVESVTIRFGKDADQEKEKLGAYARLTVRFGKDEEKDKPGSRADSDLIFLTDLRLIREFKDIDMRDRTMLTALQNMLDAGAVAGGPARLPASLPLLSMSVQKFDPAAVKAIELEVRTSAELRKFHFERDGNKPWQDKSKFKDLFEFQFDPDKVQSLVKKLGELKAERLVAFGDDARAEFKFDPKATLKIDLTLDSGKINLTVGDALGSGYFAKSTEWKGAVFLIHRDTVQPLLEGAAYFAKERVAGAN